MKTYPGIFKRSIRVQADPDNRLIIEHATRFVLDGKWSITDDHALQFHVLTADSYLSGRNIIFHGEIENVKGDYLRFRVRRSEPLSGIKGGTIELKGRWHADKDNRICFSAAKSGGRYDTLRFQGSWQVSGSNELIYRYSRTYLKTRTKERNELIFRGYWELAKHKIIYRIERADDSFLAFKASLASPRIDASIGGIRYTVGLRYEEKNVYRTRRQDVTIFGRWKVEKDLGVSFEMTYPGGKRREIAFEIEKLFAKGESVTLSLRNASGDPLGMELTLKKVFRDDAELFLALSRYGEESRIIGGLNVKF
jgi:hypothetical protein